jgi:hypothetical protein
MLFMQSRVSSHTLGFLLAFGACSDGAVPDSKVPDATMSAPMDAAWDSTMPDATPACPCPAAEVLSSDRIVREAAEGSGASGAHPIGDCRDNLLLIGGSCITDVPESQTKLHNQGYAAYYRSQEEGWICSWVFPDDIVARSYTITSVCLAAPPLVPAVPSDCVCPPVERLEARFIRTEQTGSLPVGMVRRFTVSCPGEHVLIGGSCVLPRRIQDFEDLRTNLISSGYAKDADGNDIWECTWSNGSAVIMSPSVVATCLRPPTAGTAPEAEPTADRLTKVEERDTLAAGASFVQEVTCADGDFLLLGSCTIENSEAAPPDINIFYSGFLPLESNRPNTWQCGWNNSSTSTQTAIATALCLKPPAAP